MVKKSLTLPLLLSTVKTDEVVLFNDIFDVTASDKLLTQYVRVYLNNKKRSTAMVKTRGEVHGTTKKIYKQKGTGRARHGAKKAPIFIGGGIAHGPKNTTPLLKMTKKMRRKSLFLSLTIKLKEKGIMVMDDKALMKVKKTQEARDVLMKVTPNMKKIIFVLPHRADAKKYFDNIESITAGDVGNLNAYVVMDAAGVVFTKNSLEELTTHFFAKKA